MLGRECSKDPKLEGTVVEAICSRANGKFLLAKLFIDSIRLRSNKQEIKDALKQLPPGYAGVYETTMERINAYSINNPGSTATPLALTTLSWIVYAFRPLDLAELQHALAIRLERNFSEDDIYDEEALLEKTAGLIVVGNDNGAVRVAHYTVQEYFMGDGKKWLFQDMNKRIARACLHYIGDPELSTPCVGAHEDQEFGDRKKQYPFLCYAYEYWGNHAKDAGSDAEVSADTLTFLKDHLRVATFVQAVWYLESAEAAKWEIRKGANALHVAAWFGLTDVLASLVDYGVNINAKDPFHEQTPLIYAARQGHKDTVAKLIELDALVNSRSARGRTAWWRLSVRATYRS